MIRRVISVLLAGIISTICLICVPVSAAYIPPDVSPQYSYTQSCSSELSFLGTTATCKSNATGYLNETTKIVFNQTLQKQNSSGGWSDVILIFNQHIDKIQSLPVMLLMVSLDNEQIVSQSLSTTF